MQLANKLSEMHATKGQTEEFAALKRAQISNNQQYTEAKANVKALATQYQQGQQAVAQMKVKQQELKTAMEQSKKTTDNLNAKLAILKERRKEINAGGGKAISDTVKNGEWSKLISDIEPFSI